MTLFSVFDQVCWSGLGWTRDLLCLTLTQHDFPFRTTKHHKTHYRFITSNTINGCLSFSVNVTDFSWREQTGMQILKTRKNVSVKYFYLDLQLLWMFGLYRLISSSSYCRFTIILNCYDVIWCPRRQTTLAVYLMSLLGLVLFAFTLNLGHLWVVFITAGTLG